MFFDNPTGYKKNIQNSIDFPYISADYYKCNRQEVIYNRNNKNNKIRYLVINNEKYVNPVYRKL